MNYDKSTFSCNCSKCRNNNFNDRQETNCYYPEEWNDCDYDDKMEYCEKTDRCDWPRKAREERRCERDDWDNEKHNIREKRCEKDKTENYFEKKCEKIMPENDCEQKRNGCRCCFCNLFRCRRW